MGLAVLFCLQGIPAIYYGTEQGLQGTVDKNDLHPEQSVREALWGKPNAFDNQSFFYNHIKTLSRLRDEQPALRFGRLYFREVSANGRDFGFSSGKGGLVAFSRVVSDVEVLVVANTNMQTTFDGLVLQDPVGMGYQSVKALVAHLRGDKVAKRIPTGEVVATPENMKDPQIKKLLDPEQAN